MKTHHTLKCFNVFANTPIPQVPLLKKYVSVGFGFLSIILRIIKAGFTAVFIIEENGSIKYTGGYRLNLKNKKEIEHTETHKGLFIASSLF